MISPYPATGPITPPSLDFEADYAEFQQIPGADIMTYVPDGLKPATWPFRHPDTDAVWQIFFDGWRAEQRLIANIRHNDPNIPEGYWIDYTDAHNAAIILKELAGRTMVFPPPPSAQWSAVHTSSPYDEMSITTPDPTAYVTPLTLVGVTSEWDTLYRFENPDWPNHFFEFQTPPAPSGPIWPIRAYYVCWRYYRNNSQWYWATWIAPPSQVSGFMPLVCGVGLLGLFLLGRPGMPSRRPRKHTSKTK